jgi:hypothetical protein
MCQEYKQEGYSLIKNVINNNVVEELLKELSIFDGRINNYGIRDLMNKVPYVRSMAISPPLFDIAKGILGENAKPVRSVYFDKVPEANWNAAWHQDTSIALKEKHSVQGFGPWSEKQGVVHVEPPEEYLMNTLTLRVHLDIANTETGVLRAIPNTHKSGRVPSSEIIKVVEKSTAIECNADPGDVLLMNPLLFHSSRKATKPSHRRIIHVEYSAMTLPEPLEWYECP